MTVSIKQYQQLKATADRLRREADKAEGMLQQLMKRLDDEFQCKTVPAAKKELRRLETKAEKAEEQYQDDLAVFKEKWADVIDE